MENKVRKVKDSTYELRIKLSSEEVKEYFNSAYKQINKEVQVSGFRKGKVPKDILEKYYGGLAKEKVINSVIPEYYNKVLEESEIEPIVEPVVTDVKFTPDSSFFFKVKVSVKPEIILNKYKGIKLTKKKIRVDDKEIEDMLNRIRERHAIFHPAKSDKVKRGNYIICDVLCKLNDKIIEDKKNIRLPVKEEFPIPELVKGLVGSKQGEEKVIQTVLPEGLYEKEYVGEKAKFYITISEIKERILPELNDDFAKQVGEFEKLQDLQEKIREDIKIYKQRRQAEEMEKSLIDKLLKYNQLIVPAPIVEKEKENLLKQAKHNLASKGVSDKQFEAYEEKMLKQIETQAEKRVKTYFLLHEIAQKENIQVIQEDVQNKIDSLAESTQQTSGKIKSYLKKENLLDNLISEMKVRRVIEFLMNNAKVK